MVPMHLQWVAEAYQELSTCRPPGHYGVEPIPWTAIQTYAEAEEVEDTRWFHRVIRQMDTAFLRAVRRKAKEASDGNGKR